MGMEVELLSPGMQNSADSQIPVESVAPKLQQTLCGALEADLPSITLTNINRSLAVGLESLPEQGPRLPQAVAHKNVSVVNGAVFDPKAIADMTSNLT